jgi:hypothetical protein
MLVFTDNRFRESNSPHSMALQNAMTIPNPGLDSMRGTSADKLYNTYNGMKGLSFDGTGLLGTGLFSGDISTWGFGELLLGLVAAYAIYSMFYQTKQTKYRLEQGAHRRRKSRAASYRAKAKMLEEKEVGGIFV